MNELYSSLMQVQELDSEIEGTEGRLAAFAPRLEEVRAPIRAIEREAAQILEKLEHLRKQQAKLDHGLNNKRDRLRIFMEKAAKQKNTRNEADTQSEVDFIRRAVEAEEAEAASVNDQVRRHEMRLDELEKSAAKTAEDLQPQISEIETEQNEVADQLKILQDKRANAVQHVDKNSMRLYERVRSGKRKTALAPLTAQGACGNCFNVLPLQEQSEIRSGNSLRRCEGCGIILYPAPEAA